LTGILFFKNRAMVTPVHLQRMPLLWILMISFIAGCARIPGGTALDGPEPSEQGLLHNCFKNKRTIITARGPGPKTATNSSAHTREFTDREDTRINLESQLSNGMCPILGAQDAGGNGHDNGQQGPESGIMQRFHHGRVDIFRVLGKIHGPHPFEKICHLGGHHREVRE
jgi:hypothetical protein